MRTMLLMMTAALLSLAPAAWTPAAATPRWFQLPAHPLWLDIPAPWRVRADTSNPLLHASMPAGDRLELTAYRDTSADVALTRLRSSLEREYEKVVWTEAPAGAVVHGVVHRQGASYAVIVSSVARDGFAVSAAGFTKVGTETESRLTTALGDILATSVHSAKRPGGVWIEIPRTAWRVEQPAAAWDRVSPRDQTTVHLRHRSNAAWFRATLELKITPAVAIERFVRGFSTAGMRWRAAKAWSPAGPARGEGPGLRRRGVTESVEGSEALEMRCYALPIEGGALLLVGTARGPTGEVFEAIEAMAASLRPRPLPE